MLDSGQPGESNQSLMEFGAIQCLPARPLCESCPLQLKCHAFMHRNISIFPVKSKLKKQKDRFFNFIFVHNDYSFFLEKRGDKDIWRNMFQFPLIETPTKASTEEVIKSASWKEIFKELPLTIESIYPESVHLLTHQRLHIRFFSVKLEGIGRPEQLIEVKVNGVVRYPFPKPIERFLLEKGL
jgi:A/G-specific adenine glycosylase